MADFKIIETQEQFDAAIGPRLERERKTYAKQLEADYKAKGWKSPEEIEALTKDLSDKVTQLETAAKDHETQVGGYKTTIADLNAKIHAYETDSVKTKVALEMGLPYQMASRLTGDDEKAIRADAESMAKLIGNTKPVAPLGSMEPNVKNSESSAWTSLSAALSNQ
jgi:hypothetical protein